MGNEEVIQQTMANYELANEALLHVWNQLNKDEIDSVLEKQQNRLEQIAQRMYHEEQHEEKNNEIVVTALERYEMANRHLYEHWETIPFGGRLNLMQKQWNRLQDLRTRITH